MFIQLYWEELVALILERSQVTIFGIIFYFILFYYHCKESNANVIRICFSKRKLEHWQKEP